MLFSAVPALPPRFGPPDDTVRSSTAREPPAPLQPVPSPGSLAPRPPQHTVRPSTVWLTSPTRLGPRPYRRTPLEARYAPTPLPPAHVHSPDTVHAPTEGPLEAGSAIGAGSPALLALRALSGSSSRAGRAIVQGHQLFKRSALSQAPPQGQVAPSVQGHGPPLWGGLVLSLRPLRVRRRADCLPVPLVRVRPGCALLGTAGAGCAWSVAEGGLGGCREGRGRSPPLWPAGVWVGSDARVPARERCRTLPLPTILFGWGNTGDPLPQSTCLARHRSRFAQDNKPFFRCSDVDSMLPPGPVVHRPPVS